MTVRVLFYMLNVFVGQECSYEYGFVVHQIPRWYNNRSDSKMTRFENFFFHDYIICMSGLFSFMSMNTIPSGNGTNSYPIEVAGHLNPPHEPNQSLEQWYTLEGGVLYLDGMVYHRFFF